MLPDTWESIKEYYRVWWTGDVADKIPLWVAAPRDDDTSRRILSNRGLWIQERDKFNVVKTIQNAERILEATFYGGVAFPCYWPNFGTDVFSAYMGAGMEFLPSFPPVITGPAAIEEGVVPVSWAKWNNPILTDYDDCSIIKINEDNIYWRKTKDFVSYALKRSPTKYIVGSTDIHPSIDSLAVLRGSPQQVCFDVIDDPQGVKRAMKRLWKAWHKVYEEGYHQIVRDRQDGSSAWINLWAPGRFYPVENDLSAMISPSTYEEFFLEELVQEINHLDYSIYHLDGPDALQHLDLIWAYPD